VFGLASGVLSSLFKRGTERAGVAGLTFHDSRHEAITRLAKKLDVLKLARMVGHRDIKQLMTYYNETAAEIALQLD
jgi:integrase